jgi:hypothetical protein
MSGVLGKIIFPIYSYLISILMWGFKMSYLK